MSKKLPKHEPIGEPTAAQPSDVEGLAGALQAMASAGETASAFDDVVHTIAAELSDAELSATDTPEPAPTDPSPAVEQSAVEQSAVEPVVEASAPDTPALTSGALTTTVCPACDSPRTAPCFDRDGVPYSECLHCGSVYPTAGYDFSDRLAFITDDVTIHGPFRSGRTIGSIERSRDLAERGAVLSESAVFSVARAAGYTVVAETPGTAAAPRSITFSLSV